MSNGLMINLRSFRSLFLTKVGALRVGIEEVNTIQIGLEEVGIQ